MGQNLLRQGRIFLFEFFKSGNCFCLSFLGCLKVDFLVGYFLLAEIYLFLKISDDIPLDLNPWDIRIRLQSIGEFGNFFKKFYSYQQSGCSIIPFLLANLQFRPKLFHYPFLCLGGRKFPPATHKKSHRGCFYIKLFGFGKLRLNCLIRLLGLCCLGACPLFPGALFFKGRQFA